MEKEAVLFELADFIFPVTSNKYLLICQNRPWGPNVALTSPSIVPHLVDLLEFSQWLSSEINDHFQSKILNLFNVGVYF